MPDEKMISYQVDVGGQSFRIRIEPDERRIYDSITRFVQESYDQIASQTVSSGAKAWAMTAFQLACELRDMERSLEGEQSTGEASRGSAERIERMIRRIEGVKAEG